jgi:hypothetical protein
MMTTPLRIEKLGISQMTSGRLCLSLSEEISWEAYPRYAEKIIEVCGGVVRGKTESPDIRIWNVVISQQELRLVYEDYPQLVSLESCSAGGDRLLEALYGKLLAIAGSEKGGRH